MFEVGIANLPIILFLITSYINYRQVKGSGFNRIVKYSVFFKCKLMVCILAATINLVSIIIALVDPNIIDGEGNKYSNCLNEIT